MVKRRTKVTLLYKKKEQQAYRKLVITALVVGILFLLVIFWGVPLLANLTNLLISKDIQTGLSDNIPPALPDILGIPVATNSAKITLSGRGEPSSTVEIFVNKNGVKKIIVGEDGNFEVGDIPLREGENHIYLIAEDQSRNRSAQTKEYLVIFDQTPPKLELKEPEDGRRYQGENSKANFMGRTEDDVTVKINDVSVLSSADATFTKEMRLAEGENKFEVVAIDQAGNQTKINRTLYYSP